MSMDLNDFQSDFVFLWEIRDFLKSYLNSNDYFDQEELKKGLYAKLTDGRTIRIALPHGHKVLKENSIDDDLHFVGFIGFTKPADKVSKSTEEKCWNIDSRLIEEFQLHPNILAYVSAEREDRVNWGNLVLLNSPEAITKWRNSHVHKEAVGEISPNLYSKVRIHRGVIQNGEPKAQQTLFLDYDTEPTSRTEKIWTL